MVFALNMRMLRGIGLKWSLKFKSATNSSTVDLVPCGGLLSAEDGGILGKARDASNRTANPGGENIFSWKIFHIYLIPSMRPDDMNGHQCHITPLLTAN